MKKVGIVTFHRAKNYGAMLQAYALQETLENRYDTLIVDYRCQEIEAKYYAKKTLKRKGKDFLKIFFQTNYILGVNKKNKSFDYFLKKYLNTSQPYDNQNISKANSEFDIFIAGSDQIWNMKWSGEDWNYFLEFADDEKKLSYGVGLGDSIEDSKKSRVLKNVNSFCTVLTREEEGKKLLKSIGVKSEIATVCDPVFLLDKKQWESKLALDRIERIKRKYILLYFVAKQRDSIEFARKIARERQLELVYININAEKNIPADFTNIIGIGPIEFLSLIRNAEIIITTSFHAMAFSLIFNKNFYYELCKDGSNNNSRLVNLANICGVGSREIINQEQGEAIEIDWKKVNDRIEHYAEESSEILLNKMQSMAGEHNDKKGN